MIVQVKGITVRHNGQRYSPGEEFEIDAKGYERIKTHVEVVEEDDEQVGADPAQAALEALRERGKELGIRGWHSLGIEKLAAAVAEKEAELAGQSASNDPAAQGGAGDGAQ